jgi:hypothetical protein
MLTYVLSLHSFNGRVHETQVIIHHVTEAHIAQRVERSMDSRSRSNTSMAMRDIRYLVLFILMSSEDCLTNGCTQLDN